MNLCWAVALICGVVEPPLAPPLQVGDVVQESADAKMYREAAEAARAGRIEHLEQMIFGLSREAKQISGTAQELRAMRQELDGLRRNKPPFVLLIPALDLEAGMIGVLQLPEHNPMLQIKADKKVPRWRLEVGEVLSPNVAKLQLIEWRRRGGLPGRGTYHQLAHWTATVHGLHDVTPGQTISIAQPVRVLDSGLDDEGHFIFDLSVVDCSAALREPPAKK